ncbi:19711_t:CDS:2, partial [Dentiscutata erythropus]
MARFYLSLLAVFLVFLTVVSADIIDIQVGQGGLTFTPQNVTAKMGDSLLFIWQNGTTMHSVIRSDAPAGSCIQATDLKSGNAGNHCKSGMWGVITVEGANGTTSSKTSSGNRISGGVSLGIIMVVGAAAF